jgi:hypothetical protein
MVRWGWDALADFSETAAHIRRWFRPIQADRADAVVTVQRS